MSSSFVLGQRYTLATLAMGLALLSFLNLAGLEKAILAIVLGLKALKTTPEPALERRRSWARFGIGLGRRFCGRNRRRGGAFRVSKWHRGLSAR